MVIGKGPHLGAESREFAPVVLKPRVPEPRSQSNRHALRQFQRGFRFTTPDLLPLTRAVLRAFLGELQRREAVFVSRARVGARFYEQLNDFAYSSSINCAWRGFKGTPVQRGVPVVVHRGDVRARC